MKKRFLSLFTVMAMLFGGLSSITAFASVSLPEAEGTIILRPTDATYISQHGTDNTANYYGESVMKINNTNHNSGSDDWGQYGYMKFDVSGIAKERITSAKLRVYVENEGSKNSSTRTIGIYDTCDKDWNGTTLTWSNNPYPYAKTQLGAFEVHANGSSITDAGWREIDITDYVRDHVESEFSFMVKMQTWPAYNVVLSSGTYSGDPDDFDSSVYNENMPQIAIDYCAESAAPYSTAILNPTRDTYVDQHTPGSLYFYDDYMQINYTDNESRSDRYGSYAYMDFDISDIDKETLSTAKLWVYVDDDSDTRSSTRTIGVFEPESTWNDFMTWSNGRISSKGDAIGTFTVTGNGYDIVDYGWKCVDITDYVKDLSSDTLSLMMKSISSNAHPVLVHSSDVSNETTSPKLLVNSEVEMSDVDLSAVYNNQVVSVEGSTGSRGIKQVLIRMFNPNNKLEVIDQITSDSTGYFNYTYSLSESPSGTYQILVSIEGERNVKRTVFDKDGATDVSVIYTDPVSTVLKPTVHISTSRSYLSSDYIMTLIATMTQNSKNTRTQDICTVIALYNSDGTMHSYSASSIEAQPNDSEKLGTDFLLPSDVTGMTLKVFTLEGKNTYSGSMIPLSNAYRISRTTPSSGGGASMWVEPDEPLFIDDVVFDEYADKYSVYDISYYYGHENAYHEKIVLPGQTLTISGKIKNKQTADATIGEAFYTQKDGQAQYVELDTWYTIKAGETRAVSWDVPSEYAAYPPESDPVYPSNWISDEGGLTTENQDYFSDHVKTAVSVNTNSNIKGEIDCVGDADCIKFTAATDGYYEIYQSSGVSLQGRLYAENLIDPDDPLDGFEMINSSYMDCDDIIWCGDLTAGETYAMRLSALNNPETGEYSCGIAVDTDGDSLPDIWEVTGDIDGDGNVEIPDADPYKTDIYVEINWMEGYKPEQTALDIVAESFANSEAGYENKGINLHNIWGEEYAHIDTMVFSETAYEDDYTYNVNNVIKNYFTNPIYEHAYHCALFGDRYKTLESDADDSSGFSPYSWGQTIFIAMNCTHILHNSLMDEKETAGTYMHELGHNLGLYHGGDVDMNYKPNYLSVMNYDFQFLGLSGTKAYDYSRYILPDLDENNLIESDGFDKNRETEGTGLGTIVHCYNDEFVPIAGMPYDFNRDGNIGENPVEKDLNDDGEKSVLSGYNDWENLTFRCGNIGTRINSHSLGLSVMSVDSMELPKELTYTEYINNTQSRQ